MSNQSVKISVIIPVYNTSKYLHKCLNSVINQTYYTWEAFIVNDASTDNSYSILAEYAKKDTRIKVFNNEMNKGPGITRNNAIEYVLLNKETNKDNISKNYVVFIDSDDWVEDIYFQNIIDTINRKEVDVIFIDLVQEDEKGMFIKNDRMSTYNNRSKDTIIRHQMTGKLPWGGVRKVVNTELLKNRQIRFSDDSNGEEALYSFKLLHYAKSIGFLSNTVYHYVIHENSQSVKFNVDPYGSICSKIELNLKEMELHEEYKDTLISFAFTALIVSIYRNVQYYSCYTAYKNSKRALKKFKQKHSFNLDKNSLEPRIRYVFLLAKMNMLLLIILIARFKLFINGKKV